MSVLLVTSLGDIVVDLQSDKCPLTCKNFLKLCKIKYYNGCLFHTVQKDFTAQTGDPTGSRSGGDSVYKFLYGDQARFFSDEIHLDLKHQKTGTVAMASAGENLNASQFYITLRDGLDYLDGKHTVFGEVAEGFETLTRINEAFVDENNRPYKNIRIKHTYILDDPFDDPSELAELIPEASPEGKPKDEVDDDVRLEDDWVPLDEKLGPAELEEVLRAKDAHSSAVVLESIGDIPEAEIKPPDNVLFVCKLNPVTEDEDLHTIFSRFGTILSAEIIRDYKTGDSLCYAFIEFESREACEQAYFKMDNALIDDRRIHVDFSQSVSKLWSQYRRKDQMGKGGGCFKCGATDHIAKDCSGNPSMGQPRYTLKEENAQHGGGNARYDMVFDGDNSEIPRQERKSECNYQSDRVDKYSNRQSAKDNRDKKPRYQEKEDLDERDRCGDKSRRYKDDSRVMDYKDNRDGNPRYQEKEDLDERDRHGDKFRRYKDDSRVMDYKDNSDKNPRYQEKEVLDERDRHGDKSRRYNDSKVLDYKDKKSECNTRDRGYEERKHRESPVEKRREHDTSKKDMREGRKINRDDGRVERRDIVDSRSKHSHEERKDVREHRKEDGEKRRKRSVDDDEHGDRKDDRDYKKRHEVIHRWDTRKEPSHRTRSADDDGRDWRHDHEHRRRDSDRDYNHDKRYRSDRQ